jgi:hypothetical protein
MTGGPRGRSLAPIAPAASHRQIFRVCSRNCRIEPISSLSRSKTNPPKPRPDRVPKPAKKPRRPSSGDREVRPFTLQVVEKKG